MKIPPPVRAKARRRRYRLHARVKQFARINAFEHCVYVTDVLLASLSKKQLKALTELRDVFKYNIQFEIA